MTAWGMVILHSVELHKVSLKVANDEKLCLLLRESLINDSANLNFPKAFPWKNTDIIICLLPPNVSFFRGKVSKCYRHSCWVGETKGGKEILYLSVNSTFFTLLSIDKLNLF